MSKDYRAVKYNAKKHTQIIEECEPWDKYDSYNSNKTRYCIVSTETGEILDDAQGYGYKTAQKAYAAYSYKTRDKSKDKEKALKRKQIKQWMKENKSFVSLMEGLAFDIAKGAMGEEDKFDAKFVKELLLAQGLEPDFTAAELLKVWQNG